MERRLLLGEPTRRLIEGLVGMLPGSVQESATLPGEASGRLQE
jgi:hypothetical protein